MEAEKKARGILVASSSETGAQRLCEALGTVERWVDRWHPGADIPDSLAQYWRLVCELGPHLRRPDELLRRLGNDAQVVLLHPSLDVRWVACYMGDERVSHFLRSPPEMEDLHIVSESLDSGAIAGLERCLGSGHVVRRCRVRSFEQRRDALDELEQYAREARLRSSVRRQAVQVAEELLMNAMYQAPVDDDGERLFEDLSPSRRIKEQTPRPVSLGYAVKDQSMFISVMDHYGSFRRETLGHYLLRCTTEDVQIEDKKLGAGLGLYIVVTSSSRLVINVQPGAFSEFVCVLDPSSAAPPLRLLSFSTIRER